MMSSQLSDFVYTILIMSFSGSVLILLLFALKPFIRHRLSKSMQYGLWLVTLAALLVPVSKVIAIPEAPSHIILSPIQTVAEQNSVRLEEAANAFPLTEENTEPPTDKTGISAVKPAPSPAITLTTVLMIAYILVVLIVLLFNILSYIRFTKRVRRHRTRARMEELYKHVGLCGDSIAPRLYRSSLITTPMLIGIFKPEIILPDREYSDIQIQSVLKHELTHLRRRDVIVKWLSVLACALHWFNPLVWLARREIDRICELSCDEAVIRRMDEEGKRNYGETLISVAADTKASRAVLSTTMCEEKELLKERLNVILKYRKRTRITLIFSAVILVTVLICGCVLGAGAVTSSSPGKKPVVALESEPKQSVSPSAAPAATPKPAPSPTVAPEPNSKTIEAIKELIQSTKAAKAVEGLTGESTILDAADKAEPDINKTAVISYKCELLGYPAVVKYIFSNSKAGSLPLTSMFFYIVPEKRSGYKKQLHKLADKLEAELGKPAPGADYPNYRWESDDYSVILSSEGDFTSTGVLATVNLIPFNDVALPDIFPCFVAGTDIRTLYTGETPSQGLERLTGDPNLYYLSCKGNDTSVMMSFKVQGTDIKLSQMFYMNLLIDTGNESIAQCFKSFADSMEDSLGPAASRDESPSEDAGRPALTMNWPGLGIHAYYDTLHENYYIDIVFSAEYFSAE